MRKGAWLRGRPIITNQTNKYDVDVAKAHAIAKAICSLRGRSFNYPHHLDNAINECGRAIK